MYHTITNNKSKMETITETGRDCVCFYRSLKSPLHHHPGCSLSQQRVHYVTIWDVSIGRLVFH